MKKNKNNNEYTRLYGELNYSISRLELQLTEQEKNVVLSAILDSIINLEVVNSYQASSEYLKQGLGVKQKITSVLDKRWNDIEKEAQIEI